MIGTMLSQTFGECDQLVGMAVVGMDGIIIDQHFQQEAGLDPELLAATYTSLLRTAERAHQELGFQDADEFFFISPHYVILGMQINPEAFLLGIGERNGLLGKLRFQFRRTAGKLKNYFDTEF